MNPKEFVQNTAYSAQLPYIAGHSLSGLLIFLKDDPGSGSASKLNNGSSTARYIKMLQIED